MKYDIEELIRYTILAIVVITLLLCVTFGTLSCNRDDNNFMTEMAKLNYVQQQRVGGTGTIWVKSK